MAGGLAKNGLQIWIEFMHACFFKTLVNPIPWGEIKKAILLGGESGSYRVVIDVLLWVRVQNDAVLD